MKKAEKEFLKENAGRPIQVYLKMLEKIEPRANGLDKVATRGFYSRTKQYVFLAEQVNYEYLILYNREGGFWQFGGNSAIIYNYQISIECGKKVNLRRDTDYFFKWPDGVVNIHKTSGLVSALAAIGVKAIFRSEEVIIFKLNEKYNETTIAAWRDYARRSEERLNALALPKNIFANTRNKIDMLNREVVSSVCSLKPPRFEIYGREGVELTSWLSQNIISACNDRIDPKGYFLEAEKKLETLQDWLVFVTKFQLFSTEQSIRLFELTQEIGENIKTELRLLDQGVTERTKEQLIISSGEEAREKIEKIMNEKGTKNGRSRKIQKTHR